MPDPPIYDACGFLVVQPEDDLCPHYLPKQSLLNLNRCACCTHYDAPARRCRCDKTRSGAGQERQDQQGKETRYGE